MSEQVLVRRDRSGPLRRDRLGERQVTRQLARQQSQVERATALARVGVGEIGATHRYATAKAATTVAAAQRRVNRASQLGRMTAERQVEFAVLTQAYLDAVTQITDEAGLTTIAQLIEE